MDVAENLNSHARRAMALSSKRQGISSVVGAGNSAVFRYDDPEDVKNHINRLLDSDGSANVICGMEELKKAADETDETQPQLRQGQIIFGTAPLSRPLGVENTAGLGFLADWFGPSLIKLVTGQNRDFVYLHVAVYAGKYEEKDFVIHNGGKSSFSDNLGMISAEPLEKAFHKDARFFILSPPVVFEGNSPQSTRYLVLQRALASLGTYFDYDLRAVSCETFAMTLLKMRPVLVPIQHETLKSFFWDKRTDVTRAEDEAKFQKFHEFLVAKMKFHRDDIILTLDYYMKNVEKKPKAIVPARGDDPDTLNNACRIPWWMEEKSMFSDYRSFANAVKQQNLEEVQALINKGLDIHANLRGESMNAIDYAVANGFTDLAELLEKNHAQR